MSSTLRTLMAGNQLTSFIFISSVLVQTHSADDIYSAVMPQTVTALTGSCVQIPCTFDISDFEDKRKRAESIYGIWTKTKSQFAEKDGFIAFNSSENIIRGFSDIQMTGNLSERNCTTVFYNIMKNHSDLYYFRLEMKPNVFEATFNPSTDVTKKTVRINVTDSPEPPELKLSDQRVMEETTVNLRCSAEAPCPKQPPTISWSNIPKSAHNTTQLQEKPDKTQSVVSKLTFKVSYKDHKRNITCTATYPRNTPDASTVETIVMLRVLFPPKETHVIITPSVGTNVTLTCKSRASPSNDLTYTWYKHGEETPIAWGMKINLTQTQNQTGSYLCIAQNKYGNQSSEEAQHTGQSGLSHLVIFGCTGGLLAFFLLSAVFFYTMRKKASRQAHVIGSDQAEDKNRDTMDICTNNVTAISKNGEKKETDDLHYGEIDFSKLQTGHKTEEHSNNVSETEYSELQVTQR
ncbi:sialic acid-binding Ig-like lectin 7 isoform X2 [Carassius carassius]|uniref:sialic acid-binding Ig-like lectin 7 isoform X2 n=1 Tax=Carassius carassius TaxID=217509 RepID=UPI0028686956|nr:sialic acid-binding Ig-like lectin 7 isoform X2 [Carassius carassius]